MWTRVVVLTLLALACIGEQSLRAQMVTNAVVADPPVDTKFPPGIAGITVPSHGVDMDGTLYLAAGAGSHGTVLLLHGLPGYASNGDPAQSIRRAGSLRCRSYGPTIKETKSLPYLGVAFTIVAKVITLSAWITASSLPVAAATPVPAPAPTAAPAEPTGLAL